MKRKSVLTKAAQKGFDSKSVLRDLIAGNSRFVSGKTLNVDNQSLIEDAKKGQYPKAIVLSCIDSRVPVEILFDQTIGDIFVVRVAGNGANKDILASLEYACEVAGSKLILVMGHEDCGAIKAACDGVERGHITNLLSKINPAIEKALNHVVKPQSSKNKSFVNLVTTHHVINTIETIRSKSRILKNLEDSNQIEICGAIYKITTGKVKLLESKQ